MGHDVGPFSGELAVGAGADSAGAGIVAVGNWLIFCFVSLVAGKGWEKHKPPELCLANVFLVVVAVAQLAERQVVILDVAGSSPVGYPSSGARVSVHSEARARLQFVRFIQHLAGVKQHQNSISATNFQSGFCASSSTGRATDS